MCLRYAKYALVGYSLSFINWMDISRNKFWTYVPAQRAQVKFSFKEWAQAGFFLANIVLIACCASLLGVNAIIAQN